MQCTDGGAAAAAGANAAEDASQNTVRRNRVPRDQYSALQLEGDAMTNKFHVWLGQRESEEGGYRSVHNLVRRFLTLHGLLVSVRGTLSSLFNANVFCGKKRLTIAECCVRRRRLAPLSLCTHQVVQILDK